MKSKLGSKKIINYVNSLVIVFSSSFVPMSVQAEDAVQINESSTSQKLGSPAMLDSDQLKQLVRDINKSSGSEKSELSADHKNQIDFYEAQELYVVKVLDPYADVNKVFSDVNVQVYRLIKTPADIYVNNPVMAPVRFIFGGVGNIVSNLDEMTIGSVSNLAVGNFEDSGKSFSRSIFNLVFGLGGFFDTASVVASVPITDEFLVENMGVSSTISNALSFNLEFFKQPIIHSFDDVLREWGFGCGFYMVFPVLGPQTARQVVGAVGETPFRVDTYVPSVSLVRLASKVHQSLEAANRAKIILDDIDLSTAMGKEQFYNTLRMATLGMNKCLEENAVRKFAEEEGNIITEDDF